MPKSPLGLMLLCGAVAAWQIYDLATATEAPSRAVELLQYFCIAGALLGFAGGAVRLVTEKSGGEEP